MFNIGPTELLIILLMYAIPIWALIDILRWPDVMWERAHRSRLAWGALSIFLGLLGASIYLIAIRPQLKRAASAISSPPAQDEPEPEPDRVGGEDRG
jgi:hypothetical protein